MQNKYKIPNDAYFMTLWIIRGHPRRVKEYEERRRDILESGGAKYISLKDENGREKERAYLPSGKGGTTISQTETAGLALAALDGEYETQLMYIVKQSLTEVCDGIKGKGTQAQLRKALLLNIMYPKSYPYRNLYMPGIGRDKFYSIKLAFVASVYKKILKKFQNTV